ncbi:hypothetical protein BT93_H2917 [Corymbia citriodora subsp. variegata]|nr:hypothetical protein BT93_H2917 [Corymbia citriodora subsp. variegata]
MRNYIEQLKIRASAESQRELSKQGPLVEETERSLSQTAKAQDEGRDGYANKSAVRCSESPSAVLSAETWTTFSSRQEHPQLSGSLEVHALISRTGFGKFPVACLFWRGVRS